MEDGIRDGVRDYVLSASHGGSSPALVGKAVEEVTWPDGMGALMQQHMRANLCTSCCGANHLKSKFKLLAIAFTQYGHAVSDHNINSPQSHFSRLLYPYDSALTMPKERSVNPAQAQRKAEKQKEIAKNKKNLQNQRNEKLSKRNPDRVQRQIDELKELEGRGGLRPKDKETLAQLERDVRGIRRARDALGDAAPKFPSHERRDRGDARREQQDRRQHLGKRRRDEEEAQSSDTDPEVQDIPMPRDTPPPIPRQERRPFADSQVTPGGHALPNKPPPPAAPQLVYSSAPQLRDLKKEATKFVPAAVRHKQKQVKGQGRLIEPEEIEKLEKAGYYAADKAAEEAAFEARFEQTNAEVSGEAEDVDMEDELKKFEREIGQIYPAEEEEVLGKQVQVEEVEDSGD